MNSFDPTIVTTATVKPIPVVLLLTTNPAIEQDGYR